MVNDPPQLLAPLGLVYSAGSDPEAPLTLADFVLLLSPRGTWFVHELDCNVLTKVANSFQEFITQGIWYSWSVIDYCRERAALQVLTNPFLWVEGTDTNQPSTSAACAPPAPFGGGWTVTGPLGSGKCSGIRYVPRGFGGPYRRLFIEPSDADVTTKVSQSVMAVLETMWALPPGMDWCRKMEDLATAHEGVNFIIPTVGHGRMSVTVENPQKMIRRSPETLPALKKKLSYPSGKFGKWMPVARGTIMIGAMPEDDNCGVICWVILTEAGTILGAWEKNAAVYCAAPSITDLLDIGIGEIFEQRTYHTRDHANTHPDTSCANPFCPFHGIGTDVDSDDEEEEEPSTSQSSSSGSVLPIRGAEGEVRSETPLGPPILTPEPTFQPSGSRLVALEEAVKSLTVTLSSPVTLTSTHSSGSCVTMGESGTSVADASSQTTPRQPIRPIPIRLFPDLQTVTLITGPSIVLHRPPSSLSGLESGTESQIVYPGTDESMDSQ